MKVLAGLFAVLVLLASDSLEARPHKKWHKSQAPVAYVPAKHVGHSPVVVAPAPVAYVPAHRRTTVVYAPAPAPVVHTTVVEASPVVMERRAPEPEPMGQLGLGVRGSAIMLEGQKLSLDRLENPAMGGLGLVFRGDVSERVGLELSFDYLTASTGGYTQRTMPLMLSALYYFFPTSPINPYATAGAGVHITQLTYWDGAFRHELWELAGQAGGGVRVRLGSELQLFGDVRALGVYKNVNQVSEIRRECLSSAGGAACQLNGYDASDKFNLGAQFSAGILYTF